MCGPYNLQVRWGSLFLSFNLFILKCSSKELQIAGGTWTGRERDWRWYCELWNGWWWWHLHALLDWNRYWPPQCKYFSVTVLHSVYAWLCKLACCNLLNLSEPVHVLKLDILKFKLSLPSNSNRACIATCFLENTLLYVYTSTSMVFKFLNCSRA